MPADAAGDPCWKCRGEKLVANTDEQEPWSAWENLPLRSAHAVLLGLVRPIPCPVCCPGEPADPDPLLRAGLQKALAEAHAELVETDRLHQFDVEAPTAAVELESPSGEHGVLIGPADKIVDMVRPDAVARARAAGLTAGSYHYEPGRDVIVEPPGPIGSPCADCGRPRWPTHEADAPGPTVKHMFRPRNEPCVPVPVFPTDGNPDLWRQM